MLRGQNYWVENEEWWKRNGYGGERGRKNNKTEEKLERKWERKKGEIKLRGRKIVGKKWGYARKRGKMKKPGRKDIKRIKGRLKKMEETEKRRQSE